jgi:hypothetical protein
MFNQEFRTEANGWQGRWSHSHYVFASSSQDNATDRFWHLKLRKFKSANVASGIFQVFLTCRPGRRVLNPSGSTRLDRIGRWLSLSRTSQESERERDLRGRKENHLHLGLWSPNRMPSGRATAWVWVRVSGGGLPVSTARTLDREGVSVGRTAHEERRSSSRRPPPLYIAQVTGARQP